MSHRLEITIPREELYQYFIVEDHNLEECGKKFGFTRNQIRIIFKHLNIKKVQEIKITKEDLNEYYIVQNHTLDETCKYFNAVKSCICSKLKKYGIFKPVEIRKKSDQKVKIKKEDAIDLYINKNFTLQETALKLGCSERVLRRRLSEYGIKKDGQKRYENVSKSCLKNNGVSSPAKLDKFKSKMIKTNKQRYGVPYACMREESHNIKGSNSKVNLKFEKKLQELGISYEREFYLDKFLYDFKVGDILIELNPTVTHNSSIKFFRCEPKKSDYHLSKSLVAQQYGYHCIHIFDWDDQDKIIDLFLKPKEKIFARNCEVKEVNCKIANEFLNRYHLQSSSRGNLVNIGLFDNKNQLVELMTFGKPRYNNNFQWELLRLCSSKNVIGGSSKIMKYFQETYRPRSIISYCDMSKFNGDVYKNLGFVVLRKAKPCKHWYCLKKNKKRHITDNLLRQKGFDKLFGANYGKGTSNTELMLKNDYVVVYDCGQLTFVKQF